MSAVFGSEPDQYLQVFAVKRSTAKPGDTWRTFEVVERLFYLNGRAVTYADAAAAIASWREQSA